MKTLGGSSPSAASQPLTPAVIPVPIPVSAPASLAAPVCASAQPLPVVGVPTIALLQSSSLPALVQAELERMIVCGELQPGAKLTEMALAARLGVSRGPLREAFRMLEEAGLVRTEKNRGVFVRDVPLDEAVEIFDLRAAMDELVGRQLALRITPAQLKEVRAMVDNFNRAREILNEICAINTELLRRREELD
jgi:DNA-binding GntR family transcriptional regulator